MKFEVCINWVNLSPILECNFEHVMHIKIFKVGVPKLFWIFVSSQKFLPQIFFLPIDNVFQVIHANFLKIVWISCEHFCVNVFSVAVLLKFMSTNLFMKVYVF